MRGSIIVLLFYFAILFPTCEELDFTLGTAAELLECADENSSYSNLQTTSGNRTYRNMAGCFGYQFEATSSDRTMHSFGDPSADRVMREEIAIQREFFSNIPADFYIFREQDVNSKNAFASPDGTIHFGYFLYWETVSRFGDLPVAGILAHEWAHRAQQHIGWNDYPAQGNLYMELEADAFSGFYMAMVKQWAWQNIQGFYLNVYASGDTNYHSPDHHGSPDERLSSAHLGVRVAAHALQNGISYTYNDLHRIFLGEIVNNIAPRKKPREYPGFKRS